MLLRIPVEDWPNVYKLFIKEAGPYLSSITPVAEVAEIKVKDDLIYVHITYENQQYYEVARDLCSKIEPETGKWKSIDNVPNNQRILVINIRNTLKCIEIAMYDSISSTWNFDHDYDFKETITHWMPLPEPPSK